MANNSVLYKSSSVGLTWAAPTGANKYHVQVSVNKPDFSQSLLVDNSWILTNSLSVTDGSTDDQKRYWRWRYSTDGGTTWSEWSEVGSYWMLTTAANEVTLATNKWALIDPADVTDIYTFESFPIYSIIPQNIYRVRQRNRAATLLSEYVSTKAVIALDFSDRNFISHEQARAFSRFNHVVKTFFLACYKTNETDVVQHIWKAQFEADPSMSMMASGRPGLLVGSLSLIEV